MIKRLVGLFGVFRSFTPMIQAEKILTIYKFSQVQV